MMIVIDMNLSTAWASALKEAGFEATHWSEIGLGDAPDDEIVAWARENSAVVFTRGLDFAAAITRSGSGAPSVVQLRIGEVRLERHLPLVRRALTLYRTQIDQGAIVTLDQDRVRVRVLDRDEATDKMH